MTKVEKMLGWCKSSVAVLALVVCNLGGAEAQIRFDDFDFKILTTPHFDIYYYEEELEAVREAGRMAERWYARLSRLLNHEFDDRQVIIMYASHPHFRQTTALMGSPGEGTGGVTEAFKRRIILPFVGPLRETDHVLGHELVHAFQFDMSGSGGPVTMFNFPRALMLPLWFIEGMAEYLSVGSRDPHTAMWLRDAAVNDRLPTMRQLRSPRFFPYRFGQGFWAYVAGRWGDEVVGRILNAAARAGSAEGAFQQVLRVSPDTIAAEWHEAIQAAFAGVQEDAVPIDSIGSRVLSREEGNRLNIGPVLSPDGSEIVFIGVRDRMAIEIFRADAETGEVTDRLVETAADPHFESLQFIRSAGAWSADGTRFAIAGVTEADPMLTFVDTRSGSVESTRRFDDLGEIFNPTWSPDGRSIAFAGLRGGFSDLFVYDLETDEVRALTDDKYGEMHPVWSPAGDRIAFVTDRFTTDLERLRYGDYQLALIDPVSHDVTALPAFSRGKHTNPQWASDGASLYFLSDRTGVTNVYRIDLPEGQVSQVTDLYTGVSGITALSPALSVASGTGRMAVTIYEKGSYSIYRIDDADVLKGRQVR